MNNLDEQIDELTRYIVQEHADIIYDDCTNTERSPHCECHAKIKQLIVQARIDEIEQLAALIIKGYDFPIAGGMRNLALNKENKDE